MDPNIKSVLDEVSKRFTDELHRSFTDLDIKLDTRFCTTDARVHALESSLESASSAFDSWKPRVDSAVEALKLEVHKLNKHLDRALLDRAAVESALLDPPLLMSVRPSAGVRVDGPDGHHSVHTHRDHQHGTVFTHSHVPITGTPCPPPLTRKPLGDVDSSRSASGSRPFSSDQRNFGRLPKIPFPTFEGGHPKLWLSRCETYFGMYSVPDDG